MKNIKKVVVIMGLAAPMLLAGCGETPHTHSLQHIGAVASTCTEKGHAEYWQCSGCNEIFGDEQGTEVKELSDFETPALGHDMEEHAAKDATCTEAGNLKYYVCSHEEGVYYKDENGTEKYTDFNATVVSASGHNMEHHEAISASCTETGRKEYWTCTKEEGVLFKDEDGTETFANADELIVEKIPHALQHHDAVSSTCTVKGHAEYWQCSVCNKLFEDAEGTIQTDMSDLTYTKFGDHDFENVTAKAATCTETGIESGVVHCTVCDKYFYDFDTSGTMPLDYDSDVITDALGHQMEKHVANDPTCTEAGNLEYYTCSREEGVYYKNEEGTEKFANLAETVVSPTGHDKNQSWSNDDTHHWHTCSHDATEQLDKAAHSYGDNWEKDDADNHKKVCECGYKITQAHAWDNGSITTEATHTSEGVKTFTCTVCGETKTESIPVDTSIDHYTAVMPTADKRGMREYWDDGLGNANSISFVAPEEGTAITEKTLAEADFNTAITDETDERVIYSLNELNAAVTTFGDGNYPNLRAQKVLSDYQYLDATTKASITNYSNFETGLRTLEAKGISGVLDVDEVKDSFDNTLTKSVIADTTYGEVAKLVGPESEGGGWSYAKIDVSKLPSEGYIKFAVKSTTPVDMMLHNSEWNKCIDLTDGSVVNCEGAAPSKITLGNTWKEISISCENLLELGSVRLALYCTHNGVGYGINAENPAYITEIYCGSDFANPGSITNTTGGWGTMTAEVGFEIDDTYGYLTTFKVLSVGEVLQYKFNNTLIGNYDYVTVNIYCPVAKSDLFIQSADWSGGVIYPTENFDNNIIVNNTGYLKEGWNEIKIPGAAFKNATWFAIVDTKAPTKAPVDSVYKMSLFKGGNFSSCEINAAEELIDTLPAVESLTAYDYYKIKNVENSISAIASINSSLISNYSKFTAVKTAYDAKYYLIYEPSTASNLSGHGTGCSATFNVVEDDDYGFLFQIDPELEDSSKTFQTYFYTNWGSVKSNNDKVHVMFKSPFTTIPNTSQTVWYGPSNAKGKALTANTWVEICGTLQEIGSTNGGFSESFNLQWYNNKTTIDVADGMYYYMTPIFGEIVA